MLFSQPVRPSGSILCLCEEVEVPGRFDALHLGSPHPVTVYSIQFRSALQAYVLLTMNDDDHRQTVEESADDMTLLRLFDCLPQLDCDRAWHDRIMEMVLMAKLRQHAEFASAVADTRGFTILYRSNNSYWGSGDREEEQGRGCQRYGEMISAIRQGGSLRWPQNIVAA
jgi:hypothetical protein